MERTLISFNLPNTITVVAMVAGGYVALSFVASLLAKAGWGGGASA